MPLAAPHGSQRSSTGPSPASAGDQAPLLDWTVPLRPSQSQKVTNPLLLKKNLHLVAKIVSLETGRPVGCGGATPFFMGLNAIVTNNVSNFIKNFEVKGEWRKKGDAKVQQEEEENARLGLVPDSSMMLSLLVRTAIEKCSQLETFRWEIDIKMLPTVWSGLASKLTLTHLTIKMPSSKAPMPVIDAPAIPNLKSLYVYDIDPLCYADSLSTLLFASKHLEHLKLHWSPRMRRTREPSTNIQSYFGKCLTARYAMTLKSFSMQNLYSLGGGDFGGIVDSQTIESYCLLSSMPGENDTADMAFVGYNWQWAPPSPLRMPNLKQLRGDKVSRRHATVLAAFSGLERYYLCTGRKLEERPFDERVPAGMKPHRSGTPSSQGPDGSSASPSGSMDDAATSPGDRSSPSDESGYMPSLGMQTTAQAERSVTALGQPYLEAIMSKHGPTLKELLLLPHWRLTPEDLVRLVHAAPMLEHLGFGVDAASFAALAARQSNGKADAFKGNLLAIILRIIQPHSRKLKSLRILDTPQEYDISEEVQRTGGDAAMEDRILKQTWGKEFDDLRWVGLGEYLFEISHPKDFRVTASASSKRKVRRRPLRMATGRRGLSMYRMDRLSLDV